jgi:hypothetical protein
VDNIPPREPSSSGAGWGLGGLLFGIALGAGGAYLALTRQIRVSPFVAQGPFGELTAERLEKVHGAGIYILQERYKDKVANQLMLRRAFEGNTQPGSLPEELLAVLRHIDNNRGLVVYASGKETILVDPSEA